DRVDCVRASNRLHASLRQPEVPDLPRLNELFDCSSDILDRDVWIDAVLVQEIDSIGVEPLERGLADRFDVFRPTAQAALPSRLERGAELRRNHYAVSERRKRRTDNPFIGEKNRRFG